MNGFFGLNPIFVCYTVVFTGGGYLLGGGRGAIIGLVAACAIATLASLLPSGRRRRF